MRVLLVTHRFPPAHSAGTELYTDQLARELAQRGHQVEVLTAEKDVARADGSIVRRVWRGVPVAEITNNLFYESFRGTWDHPRIEALFDAELERFRPDVVHFQHLMYLSIGCVEAAARRAIAVVFTLHDFWLQCPRFGQLVHADGTLCETIEPTRCGVCLSSFKYRQSSLERATGRAIASVNRSLGLDLTGMAKSAARRLRSVAPNETSTTPVDSALAGEFAHLVRERERDMLTRVVPHVHRFLAPSRFLRDRFVRWGLPAESIEYLGSGLDPKVFSSSLRTVRAGSGPGRLQVAFIGTLAPHKGAHVLLEAWSKLSVDVRDAASLAICGPSRHDAYRERIVASAREVGVEYSGAVTREKLPARLAALDLLVVPSLWYENAPLIILEAIATHTPLLVSNIGGMSEMVEAGRHGEHFACGDVEDLAGVLSELLSSRNRLAGYYAQPSEVPSTAQVTERIEGLYHAARAARPGG